MQLPGLTRAVCYGIGALGLVVTALTIARRIASPWPLEWMEGASLQHALRLAQGLPLYSAPSAEFVPFLYPPLAYVPVALALATLGPSLWVGRLVSVLAFAGALGCLGRLVARRTGSAAVGCSAAGLLALGFGYTGAFVDLVRVDAVFLLLVLLGLERLSAGASWTGLAWLVASCFAKQHGVIFLGAAWVGLAFEGLRKARAPAAASAVVLALGVVVLEATSDGWFLRYVWSLPGSHGLEPRLLVSYLGVDVLVYLPALVAFVALWLLRGGWREPGAVALLCWLAAGLCASALGRAHPGGADNVRLPGFALLVIAGTVAYAWLASRTARPTPRRAATGALVLQALWLLQLPAAHAPQPEHARAFGSLAAALARCAPRAAARAVALDHALLTGRPFVHTMALSDLRLSADAVLAPQAARALTAALASPAAPPSLAVSVSFPELDRALADHYVLCATVGAVRMPTGYSLEPTRIYRHNTIAPNRSRKVKSPARAYCAGSARSASPAD